MSDIFEVYDFENEQHWLKGRTNGIGGSDASAVVGMNPYKSNIDLFEEKIGRVRAKDISDKPCVIYGKKAEEYIRELFKLDYPEYKVEHHEFRILRSKEHPFMQASLDGELTDSEGRRGVLEIKTTNILQSMQYEKYIYYQVIAMRKGIRALLRADLIRLYNKYHDDYGYCPLYVKQSLEDEYKQYHTLKGNGVGTQIYHALMELPTEPPHEGED